MQVFDWEAGNSSLVTLRQASCSDVQSGVELANASVGHATVPLNQAGSFHFTSGLEGQCAAGLLLKVVVMEANSEPNTRVLYARNVCNLGLAATFSCIRQQLCLLAPYVTPTKIARSPETHNDVLKAMS